MMTGNLDLPGTALVIGAIFAGIAAIVGPIVTGYLQIKASRLAEKNKAEAIAARGEQNAVLNTVATNVNGHAAEQARQITALHSEVVRLQTPGTSTPTPESGAPVTLDADGVSVAKPKSDP